MSFFQNRSWAEPRPKAIFDDPRITDALVARRSAEFEVYLLLKRAGKKQKEFAEELQHAGRDAAKREKALVKLRGLNVEVRLSLKSGKCPV